VRAAVKTTEIPKKLSTEFKPTRGYNHSNFFFYDHWCASRSQPQTTQHRKHGIKIEIVWHKNSNFLQIFEIDRCSYEKIRRFFKWLIILTLPIYFYIQVLTPIPWMLYPHCAFYPHLCNFFQQWRFNLKLS